MVCGNECRKHTIPSIVSFKLQPQTPTPYDNHYDAVEYLFQPRLRNQPAMLVALRLTSEVVHYLSENPTSNEGIRIFMFWTSLWKLRTICLARTHGPQTMVDHTEVTKTGLQKKKTTDCDCIQVHWYARTNRYGCIQVKLMCMQKTVTPSTSLLTKGHLTSNKGAYITASSRR